MKYILVKLFKAMKALSQAHGWAWCMVFPTVSLDGVSHSILMR